MPGSLQNQSSSPIDVSEYLPWMRRMCALALAKAGIEHLQRSDASLSEEGKNSAILEINCYLEQASRQDISEVLR